MSASTPTTVPDPNAPGIIHVAAAAIVDGAGRVLLARRPDHLHQGGLWEFPGGKVEAGESVEHALLRELHEELGIRAGERRPLIRVPHRYDDRSVLLDVWRVSSFEGTPRGREGQALEWVEIDALDRRALPAANRPVVRAVQLPGEYLITPEPDDDRAAFLAHLQRRLDDGIRLVQLRARSLDEQAYAELAEAVVALCHRAGARVMLNTDAETAHRLGADGVQLSSQRLRTFSAQARPAGLWLGASCHDADELARAHAVGADFALLSPVKPTATHPDAPALGWQAFREQVERCAMPVYALGGMTAADREQAIAHGGQGVAAIRALWEG